MAGFGDLGDETEGEAGEERQAGEQRPAFHGGLLDPPTFPSALPDGPAITPQPPVLGGSLDQDVHGEVLQDILDAQARLPPLAAAQIPRDSANRDGGWLASPARLIAGPLDTDTHAEVLRDIQKAHAQLPPASPRWLYPFGSSAASNNSNPRLPDGWSNNGAGGNNGPARFITSAPTGSPVASFVFAGPASKLSPADPNIIHIGGRPFRTIDTGRAERLVPDVRVSAGGPFGPALTPSEALQKSVQENVINPSLFMLGGGEGVPVEGVPRGATLPFPADTAAASGYPGIGTTANGGPTFVDTPYLYPVAEGQLNVVDIPLTGSRRGDVKAANAMAGFARTPKDYAWHHVDDFNPATGTSSLELVEKGAHKATNPHRGSVAQYETFFGIRYKR